MGEGPSPGSNRRVIFALAGLLAVALAVAAIFGLPPGKKPVETPVVKAVPPPVEIPTSHPLPVTVAETGPQRDEQVITLDHFGRYALKLASTQGAALQVIDRMAGPGPADGVVGQRDGRVDVFLGPGEHKVVKTFMRGAPPPELTVLPFDEMNGNKLPQLVERVLVEAELGDAQQRSYWLVVPSRQVVFLEAAGRHLADLRLWKDGKWLIPSQPDSELSEAHPGQPLMVKRLTARLEPGLYRLIAYGGPGVTWTQAGTEKPFALRWGIPQLPETGRRQTVAGPFGFDRWLVPGAATYFRLELPRGEQGALEVGNYEDGVIEGASSDRIDTTKRDPVAEVNRVARSRPHVVTVRAHIGQSYVLQNFPARLSYTLELSTSTPYLVATVKPGPGEDDPDLTAVLSEVPDSKTGDTKERVLASQTIRLGPTTPWRRRFNVMGETTLLLEVTQPGRYVMQTSGITPQLQVMPFATGYGAGQPVPRPQSGSLGWNLDAGFYRLILTPEPEERGIVDLSLHGEGAPEATGSAAPLPGSAVFVPVIIKPQARYILSSNQPAGMVVRKLPADLADDLPLMLKPGEAKALTLPVIFPQAGSLQALTEDGRAVPIGLDSAPPDSKPAGPAGQHTVELAAPEATPLVVSLRFTPEAKAGPAPALPVLSEADAKRSPDLPIVTSGQPRFFDLDAHQDLTFQVKVDNPALYRVETTGLLETAGTMRTQVQPSLTSATANGVGRNMLLQHYLREGTYLLTVGAQGLTHGHLGLSLTAAPLRQGGALSPDIPARAFLGDGDAIAYDFEVTEAGSTRLRVLTPDIVAGDPVSPKRTGDERSEDGEAEEESEQPIRRPAGVQTISPLIRLEDGAGWPLTTPEQRGDLATDLRPGHYRLVVQPPPMPSRVVTLVETVRRPAEVSGHGPHPLALGATVANRWDEPAEGEPRIADGWDFTLPAEADLTITLSEGMRAEILPDQPSGPPPSLNFRKPWRGRLAAGHYRLQATAERPNNRLDYTLTLAVNQLVASMRRAVTAPARIPVALGSGHRIELTSFGSGQVKASLLDGNGKVVAHAEPRSDDWNIDLNARLPAGQYELKLTPVGQPQATTELTLHELAEIQEPAMAAGEDRQWTDGALHSQPLALTAKDGALIIAVARSRDAVGLALERRKAGDDWQTMASAAGPDATLAVPRDPAATEEYRLQIWPLAGSHAPVTLSLRSPVLSASAESRLASGLALQPLPGIEPPLGVAAVTPDGPGLIRLTDPGAGLIWGDGGEHRALAHGTDLVAVGTGPLWLVGPSGGEALRGQRVLPSADAKLSLTLAAGQTVVLPLSDDGKGPRLWLADSRAGQPGLGIGPSREPVDLRQSGVAEGSTVALLPDGNDGSGRTVRLWRADGKDGMPVSLRRIAFPRPARDDLDWGEVDRALEPGTALDLSLPEGMKQLRLALPPRLAAALLDKDGAVRRLFWPADRAESSWVESDARHLLLLNGSAQAGRLSLSLLPASGAESLAPGIMLHRSEATAGMLVVEVANPGKPMSLVMSGPVEDAWLLQRDGTARRGDHELTISGEATLLLRHRPGLLAAWLTDGGAPGWLEAAAAKGPARKTAPAVLPLSGAEMAWRFAPEQPTLMHLRSGQPVLAASSGGGQTVWPQGAALNLVLPAGKETLVGLRPLQEAVLSGSVRLATSPAQPLDEGLGPKMRLAPGDARLFTFTLAEAGDIGVGIKGEADSARMRLFDEAGTLKAEGAVAMSRLDAGRYLLLVENRGDAAAAEVQPALVGVVKPGLAPPEDIKRQYWDMITVDEGR